MSNKTHQHVNKARFEDEQEFKRKQAGKKKSTKLILSNHVPYDEYDEDQYIKHYTNYTRGNNNGI